MATKKPPTPTADPYDTAARHQLYLSRVSGEVAARVAARVNEIVPITIDYVMGLGVDISEASTEEVLALVELARDTQMGAMLEGLRELTHTLAPLANYESTFAVASLEAQSEGFAVQALQAGEAYTEALAAPMRSTGKLMADFWQEWQTKQVNAINEIVTKGHAQGLTNQQLVQALRGTRANKFEDGILPTTTRNAEAIVETSVQEVANRARDLVYYNNADLVVAVEVVATLDSHTTQQCRSLDKQRFPIGEAPRFPLHWRCRTTTRPVLAPEFEALRAGGKRSSEKGPVSNTLSYYAWLKTQPENFQDDAIGPTRAKLLRDGGLTAEEFARLNLGNRFEPLTLKEMQAKQPHAFERAGI
jgi:SPP1 gp7 family putative phage head morphogenesis protein